MAGPSELTSELKYRLLLEMSRKISRTLDLDQVLEHLIETLRSFIPYDAAGVFVLNHGALPLKRSSDLNIIAGMALRGYDADAPASDPMLKSARGIVGHVIRTGEISIVPDVSLDARYVAGRPETRSEVAVPIVVSDNVIGALNLESDRTAAFSASDVELLQFFASSAAISIEKAMLHEQLLEKKLIESQLEIAREVQSSLLPKTAPRLGGYDIAGINLPTWQVGGDYFDYVEFPNRHFGIAIADVSGKGVPSALIMATFRAALRTQVRNTFELHHAMEAVNRLLAESIGSAEFVTAFYGVLDPEAGRFTYSNCGHNPPMILRPNATELLETGGMALGVFPENRYEAGAATIQFCDTLVLYTDGVVEVTDAGGTEFGTERLEALLRAHSDRPAQEMIDAVVQATQSYSGSESYADDFTLVIVKRLCR